MGWLDKYSDGKKKFLEPNDKKLPSGRLIPFQPEANNSELASSIGGEQGEPAYLIPTFKYGHPLSNPLEEYERTGEHLGGPFKTWQEADEWDKNVRHPYVEKHEALPSPAKWWGKDYENGGEMSYYQNGLDFKPRTISKNGNNIPQAQIGLSTPSSFIESARDQREHPENYIQNSFGYKDPNYIPQSGAVDYFPIEMLALPGTPAIKGLGKIANMVLDAVNPLGGLANLKSNAKSAILAKALDNSKLNKTLAENLYVNRILEEELVAPNVSFKGLNSSLPEGSKSLNIYDSPYVQLDGRMYFAQDFVRPKWATGTGQTEEGFNLIDNTYDFMPRPDELYPFKSRIKAQKKYGVSDKSPSTLDDARYTFNETRDEVDDWIIHNDKGTIKGDETWWLKSKPYKGMEKRKLLDPVVPGGRHVFAKQSSLESALDRPLDEHRELMGDVINEGDVQRGGITITPTNEEFLKNIKDLKTFRHNPISKSLEREINYTPKDIGTDINTKVIPNSNMVDLYRVQPKDFNSLSTIERIKQKQANGKSLNWMEDQILHDPEKLKAYESRGQFHGAWYEKDPKRLDYYLKDKFDESPEIHKLSISKNEVNKYSAKNNPDALKTSLSPETEFIIPKELRGKASKHSVEEWNDLISKHKKWKNGGVVKDNLGYWNPDNFGKVVEIDSPNITMRNVREPLIGISDIGEKKMMLPDHDYKFKGKKVREYPIAKYGINDLNELTNFINTKSGKWLNKYS